MKRTEIESNKNCWKCKGSREGENRGWEENTKRPAKIRANETILQQSVCKPASSGFFTVPFPEIRKSFLTLHKSFNPTRETPFGFLLRFHSFCSPSVFLTIEIRAYSRLRKKRWWEERNLGESLERYNRLREIRESRVSKFAQMKRYCSPLGPRIRPSYLSKREPLLCASGRRLCISLAELR